jgi:dCTP deaminase
MTPGVLSDIQIEELCTVKHGDPMISPFKTEQRREIENPSKFIRLPGYSSAVNRRKLYPFDRRRTSFEFQSYAGSDRRMKDRRLGPNKIKAISFGVCSYGYDLTLSPDRFKVFHNAYGITLVDPKNFDERLLLDMRPTVDETGTWFVVPGNSYALAQTVEYIRMPRDLTAISVGKSTYARCGLITNVTPFEAGWDGSVTLELANACPAPIKVYANEGICQTVFFRGSIWPRVSYADRAGKYQGQTGLTLARV